MDNLGATAFILTFLLGGTILIGLFVIMILSKTKSLGVSRWFLVLLLLFMMLHLNTFLLFTTEFIKQYPNLLGVGYPTLFLLGPTFYFFVSSFKEKRFKLKPLAIVHAIPFVITFVIHLKYLLRDDRYKIEVINYYFEHLPDGNVTVLKWLSANAFMILFLIYIIFALRVIRLKQNGNKIILKRISWTLMLLCIAYMFLQTGFLIRGVSAITAEIVLASLMAITLLLLSYSIVDINDVFAKNKDKYETSPLSLAKQNVIKNQLIKAIEDEKIYLKQNLKIKDLSIAINVPSHHISQVLSERMQMSFYDFINTHRIEEAKRLFENGTTSKLSIEAIGAECGFGNKTSFYRAFKKFTNLTPTAYMTMITKNN